MIVVAGGSGLLGRRVVGDLLDRGESVQVLVRDPDRARTVLGDGVRVMTADLRSADGLDAILAGASVVVSAVHGFLGVRGAGPAEVDLRGNANLIDAAARNGVDVVLVSVLGAAPDSPLDLFRAKFAAEQHLRGSGVRWTIVRPAAFIETWQAILTRTAGKSGRPLVFGRGDQAIDFVSVAEVSRIVSLAATDPGLRGQVLEPIGVQQTMNELAAALRSEKGWNGPTRHLTRPLLRAMSVLARPVNAPFARQNRAALLLDSSPPAVARPE